MSDLTLTVIENLIIYKSGAEAASDGLFLTDRKVWVSDVSLISMTSRYGAQTFVGPDYYVYHLLATHEDGQRHEEKMIRKPAQDDDEGGFGV